MRLLLVEGAVARGHPSRGWCCRRRQLLGGDAGAHAVLQDTADAQHLVTADPPADGRGGDSVTSAGAARGIRTT